MAAAAERSAGSSERPRFRQDLAAEAIEDQGHRFIDVMDPDTGSHYRFYEVEYSLACGMDGERDVAGIVRWAQDELGLSASANEVRRVIATLGGLGFIGADAEATPAAEPELAAGVVAARPEAPPAVDVELGAAGTAAPPRREPMPVTPNLALGAAGTSAPPRPAAEPVEDVALGAPGRNVRATPAPPVSSQTSDVSLDLADHMAVRRDDVKEAVRASKVMSAVEMPQDLLDALEDRPSAPVEAKAPVRPTPPKLERPVEVPRPVEAAKSEPRPAPRAELKPEPVKPVERPHEEPPAPMMVRESGRPAEPPKPIAPPPPVEAPVAAKPAAKPAVELPKAPPPAEKVAVAPPAPRSGVSPALIVLLILVLAGAAAFLAWRFVFAKQGDVETSATPVTAPVKPEPPPPPAAPPAPTAKIAMETPASEDITLASAGVIETILADKTVVKAGDVIVKLVGDRPIEAEIAGLNKELTTLDTKLEAATKKRDAAQTAGDKKAETAAEAELAALQKTQGTKKDALTAKTADLEKFQLHARTGGTFSPAVKQGAKVAANGVVAHLQGDAAPTALFKVSDPKPYNTGASVDVGIGKGEQRVSCTVAEVQVDGVKVSCPADPALTDGADVTLKVPADAAGSAAGSADTGSAAPAAGSAAPTEAPATGSAESAAPAAAGAPEAPAAGSAGSSAPN